MNKLEEIKKILGKDYEFQSRMYPQKVKQVLEQNDESCCDEVVYVLNAGCVNIEMTLFLSGASLVAGYDCCIKDRELNGDWISYDTIPDEVNLDVDDIETEMFRILDAFVQKEKLSYTELNSEKRKGLVCL
jgi:hypothetical protein